MEKDHNRLEPDNNKRDYLKIEDTDNNIESLRVNMPEEDDMQVNRLKRKLNYLASFKKSSTKWLRQADDHSSAVKFGISRKWQRDPDSEDENPKQVANKF